jgi:protein-disulfide isomerase
MMLKVPVTPHDHRLGPDDALVTLVEYGDYECPACGMAYPVTKMLIGLFQDRLRFVFRHFPLAEVHPNAEAAAETAEFAAAHGRFWKMHDGLYENQAQLGLPLFLELAEALGLSPDELADALASGRYRPKVREDFMGGVRSGVNGTPTFFINGRRHDGSFSYKTLAASIAAQLREAAHASST